MDSYVDILIKSSKKNPSNQLMSSVYSALHKALFDLGSTTIGVSFPRVNVMLGNVLRLHGTSSDLTRLDDLHWLGDLGADCEKSGIRNVPLDTKYRVVSRKQSTMSIAKLNRLMKRGSIPDSEVKQYKAKMFSKGLDNPYLDLMSHSTGKRHRRYFEFGEVRDVPVKGTFNQFGLSKSATIPWF